MGIIWWFFLLNMPCHGAKIRQVFGHRRMLLIRDASVPYILDCKEGIISMETYLICLAVAMIGGLLLSRLTKLLHLPAVTAYLVAGLLLGPFCIGALGLPGFGFPL